MTAHDKTASTGKHPLYEATQAALKGWRQRRIPHSPFEGLELYRQQLQVAEEGATPYEATVRVLKLGLDALAANNEGGASLLREHYEVQATMPELARKLNRSSAALYGDRSAAIDSLAQVIGTLEARLSAPMQRQLIERLPPPSYTRLVGAQGRLDMLSDLVADAEEPWFVVVSGMGGIGKTALADAATRRLVGDGHFGGVGWVSAQQVVFSLTGEIQPTGLPALTPERLLEQLTEQLLGIPNVRSRTPVDEAYAALRRRVKEKRHLIVIDNFETAVDVERLLPWLQPLANPTKILLTSRVHPLGADALYPFPLTELAREDALALLAQEARLRNFEDLARDGWLLGSIYDVVGGNPLALRLVVGQAYLYGVSTVLEDLAHARHKGEQLYRYIYQTVWNRLDEPSRTVLLAMPLVPESGGTLQDVVRTSGLSEGEVRAPLAQLIGQNLVSVQGDAQKRLYTVHNLTRAFLKEAIIKW